jgi:hypothetical protein
MKGVKRGSEMSCDKAATFLAWPLAPNLAREPQKLENLHDFETFLFIKKQQSQATTSTSNSPQWCVASTLN